MEQDNNIEKVVKEILSDAEKAGVPWIMALFNPKLWELTKNETGGDT